MNTKILWLAPFMMLVLLIVVGFPIHLPLATWERPSGTVQSVAWEHIDFVAWNVVVILTAHDQCDFKRVVRESGLVIDTRNATAGMEPAANVVPL